MTGKSLWFCARCRCANAPSRRICAACGAFAPDEETAPREEPVSHPSAPAPVAPAPPVVMPEPPVLLPVEAAVAPSPEPPPEQAATSPLEFSQADACPVCVGRLAEAGRGERRCTACGGTWLEPLGVAARFAVPPRDLTPAQRRTLRARFAAKGAAGPRAERCPVCDAALTSRPATAAGLVWADACETHGVWLPEETRAALDAFLEAGGASLPAEPTRKSVPFVDVDAENSRHARPPQRQVAPFGTAKPTSAFTGESLPPGLPRVCPACSVPLAFTMEEGVPVSACAACAGRWVAAAAFRGLSTQAPRRAPPPGERARVRARATADAARPDARPPLLCPECRRSLGRRLITPYGPVRVDICRAHGVWFDAGELERWAVFVREGGLALPPPPKRTHRPPRLADELPREGHALLEAVSLLAHIW